MDNFLNFINNHDKHFKKYESIDEIDKSSLSGWLYIFCASCYDQDVNKLFNEVVDKFGKTINQLFVRLDQYEPEVDMKNIEAIHCTLASERERLLKAFLNERTSIRAVVGMEYFIGCRNLIKVLMLIIVYITDEEIIMYEEFYANKNKDEYSKLFDKIQTYLEEIKRDDQFELKIDTNIYEDVTDDIFVCEFCNSNFTNQYNLTIHQRTAKYCLKLQQKLNSQDIKDQTTENIKEIKCEFCNKEFTLKSNLKIHYNSCFSKREFEIKKELTKKYEKELEELIEKKDKEFYEYKQTIEKEFTEKYEKQLLKLKYRIDYLEKNNFKLENEINNYKNILFSKIEILSDFILKNNK